jgi:hypothetical protein
MVRSILLGTLFIGMGLIYLMQAADFFGVTCTRIDPLSLCSLIISGSRRDSSTLDPIFRTAGQIMRLSTATIFSNAELKCY